MQVVDTSKPPRRWSKQTPILVVSSLILGVVALVLGGVGVARSFGFALHAADAVAEVGQIAPERAIAARDSGTPASDASFPPTTVSSPSGSTGPRSDSSRPAGGTPTGEASATQAGSNLRVEANAQLESLGGTPSVSGTVSGSAGTGGPPGGAAGNAGAAGALPTLWQGVVPSARVVGQATIAMCGPNTCNLDQVCCNASCGICVAQGATCDQTECAGAPRPPTAILCGRGQCNDGQVCCNPSCGICAAPGESCSEQPCR